MNRYVKKTVLVGLLGFAFLNLTGCEYLDLKKTIKEQEATIEALEQNGADLQAQKDGLTVTEVGVETSLKEVEGSNTYAFETIEGKIKFPNKLTIDETQNDANTSYIQVGSTFKYKPSDNWVVRMKGSTMELNHSARIWGNIKSVTYDGERLDEAVMKAKLQGFFNKFPKTTIEYRKIYMEENVVGMLAKANITVDKKPHVVNVGFLTRGETGQLYLFDYEDDQSGVQQELVNLLISSGYVGDTQLTLE